MGLTKRLFKVTAQEPEWVADWVGAELVERVDVIEAQVEMLDAERDRLKTHLAERVGLIEAQVELLDAERTRLEAELVKSVNEIEAHVELLDTERDRLETELTDRLRGIEAQVELLDAERNQLESNLAVGESRPPQVVQDPAGRESRPDLTRGRGADRLVEPRAVGVLRLSPLRLDRSDPLRRVAAARVVAGTGSTHPAAGGCRERTNNRPGRVPRSAVAASSSLSPRDDCPVAVVFREVGLSEEARVHCEIVR